MISALSVKCVSVAFSCSLDKSLVPVREKRSNGWWAYADSWGWVNVCFGLIAAEIEFSFKKRGKEHRARIALMEEMTSWFYFKVSVWWCVRLCVNMKLQDQGECANLRIRNQISFPAVGGRESSLLGGFWFCCRDLLLLLDFLFCFPARCGFSSCFQRLQKDLCATGVWNSLSIKQKAALQPGGLI